MGQFEVWNFFKKHPKRWYDAHKLTEKLGQEKRCYEKNSVAMSKLRKFGILYRSIDLVKHSNRPNRYYKYSYKLVPKGMHVIKNEFKSDKILEKKETNSDESKN